MTDQQMPAIEPTLSDAALARQALRAVAGDKDAPAAARAAAARTLLELTGDLGRHAQPPVDETKPPAEMTVDEMRAELAALDAANA